MSWYSTPHPCIALRRCTCPWEWTERGQYDPNCIRCRVFAAKIGKLQPIDNLRVIKEQ